MCVCHKLYSTEGDCQTNTQQGEAAGSSLCSVSPLAVGRLDVWCHTAGDRPAPLNFTVRPQADQNVTLSNQSAA